MSAEPVARSDSTEALARILAEAAILPVLRAGDVASALAMVDKLVAAGLTTIELTTTIPDWPAALRDARGRHERIRFGVGTVWSAHDATVAVREGAEFLVSPGQAPGARDVGERAAVPFLEGGLTPTEVLGSARRGIAKLFPAHTVGARYLRDLLAVSPGARIIPTGGIALDRVDEWLQAGALAVGVGSDLAAAPDLRERVTAIRRARRGAAP